MLLFCVYLVGLLLLLHVSSGLGLLKNDPLQLRTFEAAFFFKSLAVPAFYFLYKKAYGGVEGFDAGKFFHDAEIIGRYAYKDPWVYLQLLAGLQNESPTTELYQQCLAHTSNWDNGRMHELFYNDNRIVIRVHSVLSFLSAGSYFVQALFNCFIGFCGILFLYRALRDFFAGRELVLLLVLCFFPTLWFYTGAVLKEGLVLFVMGASAWKLKQLAIGQLHGRGWVQLGLLLALSFLLKPYLLLPAAASFFLLFRWHYRQLRNAAIIYVVLSMGLLLATNAVSTATSGKPLATLAAERARVFADAARGGIFLLDSTKFVRLEYDHTLVTNRQLGDSAYRILKNVPYTYWEHSHQQDTLYCSSNADTLTVYKLVYEIARSGSNILIEPPPQGLKAVGTYLYFALCFPLFWNAAGPLQWVASVENAVLLFCLLMAAVGLARGRWPRLPLVIWLGLALSLFVLIGATTPNSGAIFRYRAPVAIYVILAAVYVSRPGSPKNSPN